GLPADRRAVGADRGCLQVRDLERRANLVERCAARGYGSRGAARDRLRVHLAGRPAERLVRGLRRAVRVVDAGLPAGQVLLVDQVEVEVGADERLAVGKL